MATESEQRKFEKEMTALGISRFRAQEDTAIEKGRFLDTSSGARLLRVYLEQVSEEIMYMIADRRKRKMHIKLLRGIDADKLAMFTLQRVIECIWKPATIQKVCANIGQMVEDELRFSKFEIELPEYYNAIQRELDQRHSSSYQHRHRVLVNRMNQKELEWHSWTNETHIQVGAILLDAAERASDLVKRGRRDGAVIIEPSDEVLEWIKTHDESIELMMPDRMPCIIPPNDWTDWKNGGFYTNRMRQLTPLVKTRAGQQRDTHGPLLDSAAMPVVLNSVNAMQRTSWEVNHRILAVVREVWNRGLEIGMPRSQPYEIPKAPIPEDSKPKDLTGLEKLRFDEWKAEARTLHGLESERKAALMSTMRAMRMAARLEKHELLWMVYQLDFRGRTYSTTSGVSPQGSDISKALLHFGTREQLGTRGYYWFRVHGANKFGYDKEDYDERVRWVDEGRERWIAAGLDPIGNADVWKGADKPYQFLAWCMEYADAHTTVDKPTRYMSALPIALDGSCNGLQHFSAMLRDPVGGSAVNLVPAARPADIYSDVAKVATEKLRVLQTQPDHEHYALACNWMALFAQVSEGKMSRKVAKKPVMTLPYGSTLQTCTASIHGWYLEQKLDFFPDNTAFKHSLFLSQILWASIGEVVIAARAAMDWLKKCARILAKHDHPIIYTNPIGFPLVQFTPNMDKKQIEAQIGGRIRMQIRRELPGVDYYKAASGVSPNLVHDIDSCHLHMTVDAGAAEGITHFAMIHDDFGVHAKYVDRWHEIIREQFYKLHSEHDILKEFKEQQELRTGLELPALPEPGNLDLSLVRKSLYFFG